MFYLVFKILKNESDLKFMNQEHFILSQPFHGDCTKNPYVAMRVKQAIQQKCKAKETSKGAIEYLNTTRRRSPICQLLEIHEHVGYMPYEFIFGSNLNTTSCIEGQLGTYVKQNQFLPFPKSFRRSSRSLSTKQRTGTTDWLGALY